MGVCNKWEKGYIKNERVWIKVIENKCWVWSEIRWIMLRVGRVEIGRYWVGNRS